MFKNAILSYFLSFSIFVISINAFTNHQNNNKKSIILFGESIGNQRINGTARIINEIDQFKKTKEEEIIITHTIDENLASKIKQCTGIITELDLCKNDVAHICNRLSIPAIIGAQDATSKIKDGQKIILDCSQGKTGFVYDASQDKKENNYINSSICVVPNGKVSDMQPCVTDKVEDTVVIVDNGDEKITEAIPEFKPTFEINYDGNPAMVINGFTEMEVPVMEMRVPEIKINNVSMSQQIIMHQPVSFDQGEITKEIVKTFINDHINDITHYTLSVSSQLWYASWSKKASKKAAKKTHGVSEEAFDRIPWKFCLQKKNKIKDVIHQVSKSEEDLDYVVAGIKAFMQLNTKDQNTLRVFLFNYLVDNIRIKGDLSRDSLKENPENLEKNIGLKNANIDEHEYCRKNAANFKIKFFLEKLNLVDK